jgi:PKHD-type hydroxylase
MSVYQFAPSPTFGLSEHNFATWENGFSYDEIQQLIAYGDAQCHQRASISGHDPMGIYRRSNIAWISNNVDTAWFYERMSYIARNLNGQYFNFDLWGFAEDFQYTIYDSHEQGHYDWHQDRGVGTSNFGPRKLSMVLQLSEPYEYDGGDLELMCGADPIQITKQRGLVVAFPSFITHRVTPVTDGTRKTLVVWITGPHFR